MLQCLAGTESGDARVKKALIALALFTSGLFLLTETATLCPMCPLVPRNELQRPHGDLSALQQLDRAFPATGPQVNLPR
jgi:hypothetical protein